MSAFGNTAQAQGGGLFGNNAGPASNNPTPNQQSNAFGE